MPCQSRAKGNWLPVFEFGFVWYSEKKSIEQLLVVNLVKKLGIYLVAGPRSESISVPYSIGYKDTISIMVIV